MYRAPAGEDRSLLITAFQGKIFGITRADGYARWMYEIEAGGGEVELAVESGVVIACTRFRLILIDYATGTVLRFVHLVGEHPRRPTMLVDQGQIIVARDGEVACYSLAGDLIWLQPFKGEGFGSISLALPGNVRQADDVGSK